MKILYIGDVMGEPGMRVVEQVLPGVRDEHGVDFVIAQAENISDGKGMLPADMDRMKAVGVHFFTGGNHTPKRPELHEFLQDENVPVIGPANMKECPGRGWKYADSPVGRVLVISLLGATFSTTQKSPDIDNPLHVIDQILQEQDGVERAATIVNFHGDFSSEKRVIGYYLDGRATAVLGDHWHVPTADAMVLPNGTAHMTDVGMCGSLHSSLGVKLDVIIPRWRDAQVTANELELNGTMQFNAALVEVNDHWLAASITHIQKIL